MRPLSKKNSDEDRSRKKKKIKSKSAKRRRDPSISSYSSSESESDYKPRKKSSRSKKLEKRKRGSKSKKLDKKKNRKKRSRRDSSVSSFSSDSGCKFSPCSDSEERSRSPVRKSKPRKRDRKSSRRHESSRSRSRYRSPSCSTCRGSRSPSPSHSPIVDRFQSSRGRSPNEKRIRSQSRPLVGERFGSSEGRSPIEERSRSPSCSPFEERFQSGRGGSLIEEISQSHSHSLIEDRFRSSRSPIEDRLRSSGQCSIDERYSGEGERKRLKSVVAVVKTSDNDEDKIINAYDDYPSSRSYDGYDKGGIERNLEAVDKRMDSYEIHRDPPVKDSDVGDGLMKDDSMRKENNVVSEDGVEEAAELELILRQKALENLKKFRGARPVKGESLSDKKDDTSKPESCQGSQHFIKPSESKPPSSLDDQRLVKQIAVPNELRPSVSKSPSSLDDQRLVKQRAVPSELKAKSVVNMTTEKNDGNKVHNLSNYSGDSKPVASSITSRKTPDNLKRMQVSSNKMPVEEASLAKDNQNKRAVTITGSGGVGKKEVVAADTPTSRAPNPHNENCKSDEPIAESASGGQFEEKTFSRMRDGEMVQVSYKVYIPKKTPALARRQLQR
ncbi:pre-mRNA-splicing factor CWC22 homolog [Asparagus officinalis]|nr:pre-mRNA-splicing factor CWC22 homolog [Asparagus officinalis]XP_020256723.1 pre-mRNA-splicing factor CWC22 homolog [Asparagus officinalis]